MPMKTDFITNVWNNSDLKLRHSDEIAMFYDDFVLPEIESQQSNNLKRLNALEKALMDIKGLVYFEGDIQPKAILNIIEKVKV